MQNVFYKIKYKDFKGTELESIHTHITGARKYVNTLNNTSGISDVKLFIVYETEEELSFDQLPK